MDSKALELLLTDAREQYKAELDRAGQVYTKCGIYFAVLAIYAGAIVRFFDKPPVRSSTAALVTFIVGAAILVLATVGTLLFALSALWGRTVAYTLLPDDWINYVTVAEPWFAAAKRTGYTTTLEDDIKERMLRRFAEATKVNYGTRTLRLGFCHWASQTLAIGFMGLLISAGAYSFLVFKTPATVPVTSVRVVDPVEIHEYKRPMADGVRGQESPPASGSGQVPGNSGGGGQAQGRVPTATPTPPSPSTLPPKPEPRSVRVVKDGEVRPRVLKD